MKIIDEGIPTKLKFGKNRDLDSIRISSTNATCDENIEIARAVLIRNGEIFESECGREERLLILSTNEPSNIPKMISFPGEHFISFIKLNIQIIVHFLQLLYIFTSFKVNETLKTKAEHFKS